MSFEGDSGGFVYVGVYRSIIPTPISTGGSSISLTGGTGKQFMIVCITKNWIKHSGIDM